MDLAVRDAMARVEPRLVYYPEPSTFVKVPENLEELEPGVSFGSGPEEGQHLVDSLYMNRDGMRAGFDSRFAISTDMRTRLGENIGSHTRGTRVTDATIQELFKLVQTHARRQEWEKRVENAYGISPAMTQVLGELVFAGLAKDDLTRYSGLTADALSRLSTPLFGARSIDRAKQLKGWIPEP
ncbi:hypothetical protein NKH18_29890 [Streptomyces sp. M10(2022)]